ncbi:hypothetical protein F8388_020764 [Cannabis sativa]|uniref:DUF4283 domain-containing protein n=1 Tax=Cannabis sativa TaxID=3483 RepID=A0A7J6EXN8_CANSA|nr:hypothetical protein F8388_020764 [Cannabis sativa]
MAGVDCSNSVDDLVNLTNKLVVEQEDDWEVNEDAATDFGERSLMGRIVAKRGISANLFQSMFNRIWRNVSNWKVKVLDGSTDTNLVGISFQSKQDAQWVLDKQPWIFNGGFLILEEWPRSGNWQDAKLDKVFSWVRIRGFPLKVFTLNNVKRFSSMAGEVVDIKWSSTQQVFLNNYVRVRIGFPLVHSIFVGRFIPSNGSKVWVQIKFEKLPLLYFKCGVWGHEQVDCAQEMAMESDVDGRLVPKYGSWLKEEDSVANGFRAFDLRNNVEDGAGAVDVDVNRRDDVETAYRGETQCPGDVLRPVEGGANGGAPMMVEQGMGSFPLSDVEGVVGSVHRGNGIEGDDEVARNGLDRPNWREGSSSSVDTSERTRKGGSIVGEAYCEPIDGVFDQKKRKCGGFGSSVQSRESAGFEGLRSSFKGKEVVQEIDDGGAGGGFARGEAISQTVVGGDFVVSTTGEGILDNGSLVESGFKWWLNSHVEG